MISAISKYMPRWLMAVIATALVLATLVGSSQDSAEAIDPGETDTVYIADGTNFADALMGATIASLNTSPMLGVAGTNGGDLIPEDTADELDRLTNDKASPLDTIFIFGGTSAVSANVATQLEAWATNVERIAGDSRWGTYEAISQMLPSTIDEAAHAQEADNADTLDSMDSTEFLGATEQAADSDLLDGKDSTDFLGATEQAADSDLLDGQDSAAFAGRLWAVVNADGTLARGHNVITVSRVDPTGSYNVVFNRHVTGCSYNATIGSPGTGTPDRGFIVTAAPVSDPFGVYVETRDTNDASADRPFHLQVIC